MTSYDNEQPQYELLAPRFDGYVCLSREQGLSLFVGQRGHVAHHANNRSIADHLISRMQHWFNSFSGNLPQVF
jgi:hypothetical protein